MKDIFFADRHDVSKWGLLRIAAIEMSIPQIVQVAFLRYGLYPALLFGDKEFTTKRDLYFDAAVAYLKANGANRKLVLLDPDTGLRDPDPGLEHVTSSEVPRVWEALDSQDCLALYQHVTNRKGEPWIKAEQSQFARARRAPRA